MLQPGNGLLPREKSAIVTLPLGTSGSQGAVRFFEKYASVMSLFLRLSCWITEIEKALRCSSSLLTSHTHTHQCHGKTLSPMLTPVTNAWVNLHYFRTYLARCKSKSDELSAFLRTTLILHQWVMNSSMEMIVTDALNTHLIAETSWVLHQCKHGYTSHQESFKKQCRLTCFFLAQLLKQHL